METDLYDYLISDISNLINSKGEVIISDNLKYTFYCHRNKNLNSQGRWKLIYSKRSFLAKVKSKYSTELKIERNSNDSIDNVYLYKIDTKNKFSVKYYDDYFGYTNIINSLYLDTVTIKRDNKINDFLT